MPRRGVGVLLVLVPLVAGCATSRIAYTKPGVTDEERKRDQTECLKSAIGHDDGRGHILEPVTIDRDVFQGCLENRGYVPASI